MITFGDRLKEERKRKGISLDKMSQDLNTTKSSLSRYENNLREPKYKFLNEIADYLNCSIDYLMGRTNHKEVILVEKIVGNDDVKIEVDKNLFPDGMTYGQVIELLNKLKKAGLSWDK